ncbi:MAG: TerB family tellurite resistance protein [Candidatus Eisenbacteria bacterium]|uniref:TerB family tellurite resistance protein n=1 Tax=Eiseniibacteriota bacterium TaxID=2212470 RepID=A0A849T307_UNCEI|nr:TerB family tellurite resistance protein [Candidatus Eisenbacteria bacterium]
MFEALKSLLTRRASISESSSSDATRPLQIAACALLLELAHADDEFTHAEREHITASLVRHFGLAADEVRDLLEVAEEARRDSVDLHQFTSVVARHYDEGQRVVLAELMWRVAYADGHLSSREDYLTQKFSRLLDLRPGYLADARGRAMAKPAGD